MASTAKTKISAKRLPSTRSPKVAHSLEFDHSRSPIEVTPSSSGQQEPISTAMADTTDSVGAADKDLLLGQAVLDASATASLKMQPQMEGKGDTKVLSDQDELPIELISLADSFIDSLTAKVHPTPPSIDKLSGLFQDFYAVAATHINTHIAALATRQSRSSSPTPSLSSLSSIASKNRGKAGGSGGKDRSSPASEKALGDQQLMTTEEIAERKRVRRSLEHKKSAMEEAVEKRVCEGVYDRIWRHRSTQDEAQDDKLRSKTAALSVVGIGLVDLGVDLGTEAAGNAPATLAKDAAMRERLAGARSELAKMNTQRCPLGKLHHLKGAHRHIVDTLAHFHPSSSADEIMPTLIYTLITMPTEDLDVISNLYYIQRFRNEVKVDGEAAYCLTNLEAAITFLETVDLSSLRADEAPSGPPKSGSRPSTPPRPGPPGPTVSSLSAPTLCASNADHPIFKPPPTDSVVAALKNSAQPGHSRRLSNLSQPPAQAIGAASDAILDTADQGFKTIGNSLGESYRFLVGKLKERQEDTSGRRPSDVIVPRTLEDARRLVSTPPLEDEGPLSEASFFPSPSLDQKRIQSETSSKNSEDRVLSMITGSTVTRDRSIDRDGKRSAILSKTSAGVPIEGTSAETRAGPSAVTLSEQPRVPSPNPAGVMAEGMRSLGNTLNPISKFAGMSMMRGFGRSPAASPVPPPVSSPMPEKDIPDGGIADLTATFPELAMVLPPKELPKIAPPKQRFTELQNPGDLKISEVMDLLRDYRRLANALKERDAF